MADSARPPSRRGVTSVPDRSAVDVEVQKLLTGVVLIQVRGSVDAARSAGHGNGVDSARP